MLKQSHAGATLPVTAYDRTGATKLAVGKLETIDNQIDTTTGTVKLRAIFDNADESLFPNQFVNIKLLVNTLHDAVLVPTAAIQRGAPGHLCLSRQAEQHGGGANGQARPGRRPARRGPLRAASPAIEVVDDGADRLQGRRQDHDRPAAGSAGQPAAADNRAAGRIPGITGNSRAARSQTSE